MTNEDIIRMANEARLCACKWVNDDDDRDVESLYDFAALIAADEREACAKLCDAECNPAPNEGHVSSYQAGCYITAEYLAADIRRRGQS